jgi:hypothetical protein
MEQFTGIPLTGGAFDSRYVEGDRLRAALLGVYARTKTRNEKTGMPDGAMPPMLRPKTLQESIAAINASTSEQREPVRRLAACRLTLAHVEGQADFRPSLGALVGPDMTEAILNNVAPLIDQSEKTGVVDKNQVMRGVYQIMAPAPALYEMPAPLAPLAPQSIVPEAMSTTTVFDKATLLTTTSVSSGAWGNYDKLAALLDPQTWSTNSPFFIDSYSAVLKGGGKQAVKDPHPPPIGATWSGHLYEYVRWSWNDAVISAYQNYLNISFVVTTTEIRFHFSLFASQGSLMLTRVANDGIEVDSGFLIARKVPGVDPVGPLSYVVFNTQKALRSSSIVSRRTSNQGPPRAGDIINYNTPVVLTMFMDYAAWETIAAWQKASLPAWVP